VLRGTLASRPDDTIGFVFTRQQYSDEALEDQRILRSINGGVGTPASSQTMLELSYGYQLNDHVRIQPNVHYIINPDQFAQRDRVMALDDAIVLGLRFDVNLAALIL
ncbi:MAG: carbohydrate porin, partial [Pseudomonadota bacterium]|nr:carbohydrate porin [Pseudomonadota bacterium]